MRYKGIITDWKDERGFGFISPIGGGGRVFAHISSFANRARRPGVNAVVTYELKRDSKGRLRGENIAFSEKQRAQRPARVSKAVWVAVFFLVLILGLTFSGSLPIFVLGLYVVGSAATYAAYAVDKAAARQNRWRISEGALHALSLLGGWPGALVAQRRLRHKSRKRAFQVAFWLTVMANCVALLGLLSGAVDVRIGG